MPEERADAPVPNLPRPYFLAPVTLGVAGALYWAGLTPADLVWGVAAAWGSAVAILRRDPAVWPVWAGIGLAGVVGLRLGGGTFGPAYAVLAMCMALGMLAAALVLAATTHTGAGSGASLGGYLRRLLGLAEARWEVVSGRIVLGESHGPGRLVVAPDWIVVTQRAGEFARIVPPGSHVDLSPGEHPRRALPVGELIVSGRLEEPLSRDAVRIQLIHWSLRARLRSLGSTIALPGGRYEYDPLALRQAAWGPADLSAGLASAGRAALADAIRGCDMTALFDPTGEAVPMSAALDAARVTLALKLDGWGLELADLRIDHIELAPEIQDHLTAVWHARLERQIRGLARAEETAPVRPKPERPAVHVVVADEPPVPVSEAAPRDRAAPSTGRSAAQGPPANPASFGRFLGSLRQRAQAGDEAAAAVLKQVLDVMSRLDADGSRREARRPTADPGAGAGPGQPDKGQPRLL